MKDSRLSIWTPASSHTTGTSSVTGPTVDMAVLGVSLTTGREQFSGPQGLGVQIIQTRTSGTAQVTEWTYQISEDASTWRDGGFVGVHTMDNSPTTKYINATIYPAMRYFRLYASNTGTGASTSKAFIEDTHGLPPNAPSASHIS